MRRLTCACGQWSCKITRSSQKGQKTDAAQKYQKLRVKQATIATDQKLFSATKPGRTEANTSQFHSWVCQLRSSSIIISNVTIPDQLPANQAFLSLPLAHGKQRMVGQSPPPWRDDLSIVMSISLSCCSSTVRSAANKLRNVFPPLYVRVFCNCHPEELHRTPKRGGSRLFDPSQRRYRYK